MIDMRLCANPSCRKPLFRRPNETLGSFEARRACGRDCARAVPEYRAKMSAQARRHRENLRAAVPRPRLDAFRGVIFEDDARAIRDRGSMAPLYRPDYASPCGSAAALCEERGDGVPERR